jgi:hypothetical protein
MLRLLASLLLLCLASSAAHADSEKLVGVWKLKSFYVENVDTKQRYNDWGEHPNGFVIITADRFTGIVTADGRKAPTTDEKRLRAFRWMAAYSGLYTLGNGRLTTRVDVAWNESWVGTDQVRLYRFTGDTLVLETLPGPAPNVPERGTVRAVLEWERSK